MKRANARMRILHKISKFSAPVDDMVQICISYIRYILEQSRTVFHSRLTQLDVEDLERVQKGAIRFVSKKTTTAMKRPLKYCKSKSHQKEENNYA